MWVRPATRHHGGVGWCLPSTDRKNRSEAAAPITCPAAQVKEALTALVFAPYATSCIALDPCTLLSKYTYSTPIYTARHWKEDTGEHTLAFICSLCNSDALEG